MSGIVLTFGTEPVEYIPCMSCYQSIKTYLAGIRHTQVTLGLAEPRPFSPLPRLKLVIQADVARTRAGCHA